MTENQPTQPPADQVTLTLEDLSSVLSIIDVATQRGAFRPKEFTAVGKVYEKIADFLEQVKGAAAPESGAGEPAADTSTDE
jgi:hypothetical protein